MSIHCWHQPTADEYACCHCDKLVISSRAPDAEGCQVTVDEMGGAFEGGPDSVEWLREARDERIARIMGYDD
jgi:hypothetical protein